ncbi:hypothetical protein CMO96_00280 [Candidatus Woesebacteria bacterium]|nr:hypothetical protein [Candidatus Woesebacteria bacterium]
MKTRPQNKTFEEFGIQDSVSFGIKSSGLAHIFNVLRNQLYSDKITAVIREYSVNALDAHVEADIVDTPIEVTLPTQLNSLFKVRDYGKALNDEEIKDVYAFYGESTKRNTNDQVGMLGIGSKSAFSYGDNFLIDSYIDGKKHSYNAFIDPSQIGQIAKLHVEDTNEPDGIEITIAVGPEDYDEFQRKAENLFRYFKVKPIIKGVGEDFINIEDEVLFSGDNWYWRKGEDSYRGGDAVAVMGGVAYPIDRYETDHEGEQGELLRDNLVMEFDIGDLDIAASREKLQFTDYTKSSVKKRLVEVEKEIIAEVQKQFEGCKTLFDAKCLWNEVFDTTSGLHSLRGIIASKLEWNGEKVKDGTFSTPRNYDLYKYEKGSRGGKYRPQSKGAFNCRNNHVLVFNDLGHRRGSMGRVLSLILEEEKVVYLLELGTRNGDGDTPSLDGYKENSSFDGEVTYLSKLEKRRLSDFTGYGTVALGSYNPEASKKSASKILELDWAEVERYNGYWKGPRAKSEYWNNVSIDIKKDSGVYLVIDKYLYRNKENQSWRTGEEPKSLWRYKEALESLGVTLPTIYGVKIKEHDKFNASPNWTNFWDWAEKAINDKIESENLVRKLKEKNDADNLDLDFSIEKFLRDKTPEEFDNKDNKFLKFARKYQMSLHKNEKEKLSGFANTARLFDVKLEESVNALSKRWEKVLKEYPMLGYVDNRSEMDDVIGYINLVK